MVHPTRPIDGALATLTSWTREHGLAMVQLANRGQMRSHVAEPADLEARDLVVALGGDGTVLTALRSAAAAKVPVLGVACGSLGALTAVAGDQIAGALSRIWTGDWTPRSLPALVITVDGGHADRAFNDFLVIRGGAGQLAAAVTVDDELYVRCTGDGVIVATALGSSAYSMAAGGPLLTAGTPSFVCTPLAMHGGSAPPLVMPADAALTVDVMPGHTGFVVEVDGHRSTPAGRSFKLTLEPDVATLVRLGPPGRGLAALRKRRLVADSPRLLMRDDRGAVRAARL
jgi:NAD+ kinase